MKDIVSLFLVFLCLGNYASAKEAWAPDFTIIGAQKAGTTALSYFIKQHPQVVKKNGEIHFFDVHFDKGVEWYKRQFPPRSGSEQLIMDKSPYYLFHPLAPARLRALYPNVKILIVLRNPIDRAYSHYWHVHRTETLSSFEEAIDAEASRLEGEEEKIINNPSYYSYEHRKHSYLARGIYVDQIKRWLSYFPKEQIHIVIGGDLRKRPQMVMDRVFAFLGLPSFVPQEDYSEYRSSYPPMNPATRERLANYYRPYNKQLEELLGRNFNWD